MVMNLFKFFRTRSQAQNHLHPCSLGLKCIVIFKKVGLKIYVSNYYAYLTKKGKYKNGNLKVQMARPDNS